MTTLYKSPITHRPEFSVTLLGSGSQHHRFLSFHVPQLWCSLAGAYFTTHFTVFSQALFLTPLRRHCLVTGVPAEPFPSNGCLCWIHNSGFRRTCHNILTVRWWSQSIWWFAFYEPNVQGSHSLRGSSAIIGELNTVCKKNTHYSLGIFLWDAYHSCRTA
jgi:hypothetical protein